MAIPTPASMIRAARNQLGSIRKGLLGRNRLVRRDDFDSEREVVVLLHGFFQTRNIWDVMEDRLRYDGYSVMTFNLGGVLSPVDLKPVDHLARIVGHKIDRLCDRYALAGVHVVGHARGGIVARRYVESFGGSQNVKSVITLGTPHRHTFRATMGSMLRRVNADAFPASVPMTSIYSTSDWITPPFRCALTPLSDAHQMSNAQVHRVGHSELVWDPGVYRIVRDRLADAAKASEQPK